MVPLKLIVDGLQMLDNSIFLLDRPLQSVIQLINFKHLLFELLHLHVDFSVVLSSILTISLVLFLHLSELLLNPFDVPLPLLLLLLHFFDLPNQQLHLPLTFLLLLLCLLYHQSVTRNLILEPQVYSLQLRELLLKRCLFGESQIEALVLPP